MNKKIKRRPSWMVKLIILYVIVMGIILLTQVLYTIPYIKDRELEASESYQEEIAKNISKTIDNNIFMVKEELIKITSRLELINMDIEAQTHILTNQVDLSAHLMNLFVMDSEGWFVSSSLEDLSPWQKKSHSDLPPYQTSFIKSETYYSSPSYFESVGEISFYIGLPVKSKDGKNIGVLIGTMLLNELIEMIYKYELKEGTNITLFNNEGIVIASSGVDLFALEDGPLSLDISERSHVQAVMLGTSGSFEDEHDGISYLHSTSITESTGWGVIVETPMDVLMDETNSVARFLWIINGILFIVSLIILVIFSRQIDLDRLRTEKKLIRKEKLAVLGQLSGGVAHELRNPLTTIKNASYFLNIAIKEPTSEIKKTMKNLDKGIASSEKIISNILELGRPGIPIKKKIDIGKIIQDVITQAIVPGNIEVFNNIDKDIPNISADPDQITQIFSNIILNAIQALPEGGKLTVTYAIIGKTWLDISVTDTGVGILEENIDSIFEPLFTTKAKGIGLGMAITKTLVEAHGGNIRINSKAGVGTTFTVALPLIKEK